MKLGISLEGATSATRRLLPRIKRTGGLPARPPHNPSAPRRSGGRHRVPLAPSPPQPPLSPINRIRPILARARVSPLGHAHRPTRSAGSVGRLTRPPPHRRRWQARLGRWRRPAPPSTRPLRRRRCRRGHIAVHDLGVGAPHAAVAGAGSRWRAAGGAGRPLSRSAAGRAWRNGRRGRKGAPEWCGALHRPPPRNAVRACANDESSQCTPDREHAPHPRKGNQHREDKEPQTTTRAKTPARKRRPQQSNLPPHPPANAPCTSTSTFSRPAQW